MYRFLVKFFAQKNSSVLKKITGGHFSQNKSVGFRCHEHGYFTSLNKAQFFGEKPLHPSLLTELSEIRNDTDSIPENENLGKNSTPASDAFSRLQKRHVKDQQNFKALLKSAIDRQKDAEEDILSAVIELESNSVIYLGAGACLSCLKIIRSSLSTTEAKNALIVKNLENTLVWRARSCSVKDLTMILSYCMKHQSIASSPIEAHSNSTLLKEVMKCIERRWVEISDGRLFASVLHYPGIFTEQFILKIEGRITELAETLPSSDLITILKTLGFKGRRSLPLLRSIAYHLMRSKDELDLTAISSCLFAMKELSFKDQDFLDFLCNSAVRQLESETDIQMFVLRSILFSLGQIRFRHSILLDQITNRLTIMKDELDDKDLIAFVMTNAALNHKPKDSEELFSIVEKRLSFENLTTKSKLRKEVEWLDIVWSLAVLQKATAKHFKSVLSSDFYHNLLYSHDQRNVGVLLKLLNVNAVARFVDKSYSGSIINVAEDSLLRNIKLPERSDRTKLSTTVLSSIESLASPPDFLCKDVNTLMGFQLDGEAIFDSNLKPIAIADHNCFATQLDSQGKNLKDVPASCSRVAFLVIGFHETLIGNNELTGLAALHVKLLESLNYKVVTFKHSELKPHHKNIDRVKIIQEKLKSAFEIGN